MSQKKFLITVSLHFHTDRWQDQKNYIEDGLKCKTANWYLKCPKYVSHEVPRNLIEKILNIALICESKPVTGNLWIQLHSKLGIGYFALFLYDIVIIVPLFISTYSGKIGWNGK